MARKLLTPATKPKSYNLLPPVKRNKSGCLTKIIYAFLIIFALFIITCIFIGSNNSTQYNYILSRNREYSEADVIDLTPTYRKQLARLNSGRAYITAQAEADEQQIKSIWYDGARNLRRVELQNYDIIVCATDIRFKEDDGLFVSCDLMGRYNDGGSLYINEDQVLDKNINEIVFKYNGNIYRSSIWYHTEGYYEREKIKREKEKEEHKKEKKVKKKKVSNRIAETKCESTFNTGANATE